MTINVNVTLLHPSFSLVVNVQRTMCELCNITCLNHMMRIQILICKFKKKSKNEFIIHRFSNGGSDLLGHKKKVTSNVL